MSKRKEIFQAFTGREKGRTVKEKSAKGSRPVRQSIGEIRKERAERPKRLRRRREKRCNGAKKKKFEETILGTPGERWGESLRPDKN